MTAERSLRRVLIANRGEIAMRIATAADGLGVESVRVETLEAFADAFRAACAKRGPLLIEFAID